MVHTSTKLGMARVTLIAHMEVGEIIPQSQGSKNIAKLLLDSAKNAAASIAEMMQSFVVNAV